MAYEDPRAAKRDEDEDKRTARKNDDDKRNDDWDNQDDGDFRYTDWASI